VSLIFGCKLQSRGDRTLPLPPNTEPEQVIDADDPQESISALSPADLALVGRKFQAERKKQLLDDTKKANAKKPKKYNILACSGGAVYGAFSAGILCGWTESGLPPEKGGRPVFDMVTGISTGAIIAPFAFLGPKYDCQLRDSYITITTKDLYTRQRSLRNIIAESFVDNTKFRERIVMTFTDSILAEIAVEHEKGRRLIIGTTNLDTKRITLWDIGAIAKRGTPDAYKLVRDVITASASIPGFFPPVKINVTIDGRVYEELHVDGGITRSLFFRPPYFGAEERESVDPDRLADSNLYILVAGKIDPSPAPVKMRTLPLAMESTSILLYSITRGDLYRMYNYCLLTGMNLRISAIPDDQEVPKKSFEIEPEVATKMFQAGYRLGVVGDLTNPVPVELPGGTKITIAETRDETAWRDLPPGLKTGEKQGARTGRNLTVMPKQDNTTGSAPRGPDMPKSPPIPAPIIAK